MTRHLIGKDYLKYKVENSCPVGCPKKENVEPPPTALVVCNICLCHYGKGLPHKCSKSSQIENATNLCKYYYIDYRVTLPSMPLIPEVRETSVFTQSICMVVKLSVLFLLHHTQAWRRKKSIKSRRTEQPLAAKPLGLSLSIFIALLIFCFCYSTEPATEV